MFKKLTISIIIVTCILSEAVAKVYDIAGVIGCEKSESIACIISDYQAKTGIIITILTMGREDERFIANNSGVADNEILVKVIPWKKFYGVEVGAALNKSITNNYASLILRRSLSDSTGSVDYSVGMETFISNVIEKLGSHSITERLTNIRESESKGDLIVGVIAKVLVWLLIICSFCLTVFFIFSKSRISKQRIKKMIIQEEENKSQDEQHEKVREAIENCEKVDSV